MSAFLAWAQEDGRSGTRPSRTAKKQKAQIYKITLHFTNPVFLYIFLLSLHDYDLKTS